MVCAGYGTANDSAVVSVNMDQPARAASKRGAKSRFLSELQLEGDPLLSTRILLAGVNDVTCSRCRTLVDDGDFSTDLTSAQAKNVAGQLKRYVTLHEETGCSTVSESDMTDIAHGANAPTIDFAFIQLGKAIHSSGMAVVLKGTYANPRVSKSKVCLRVPYCKFGCNVFTDCWLVIVSRSL